VNEQRGYVAQFLITQLQSELELIVFGFGVIALCRPY
jgi:hypothetical protein